MVWCTAARNFLVRWWVELAATFLLAFNSQIWQLGSKVTCSGKCIEVCLLLWNVSSSASQVVVYSMDVHAAHSSKPTFKDTSVGVLCNKALLFWGSQLSYSLSVCQKQSDENSGIISMKYVIWEYTSCDINWCQAVPSAYPDGECRWWRERTLLLL